MMKISNPIKDDYKIIKIASEQYGESKASFYLYMILRIFVIAVIVVSLIKQNYEFIIQAVLALIMFCLPPFFERRFKADLSSVFEIIVLLFIFSANILGEVFSFYQKIPGWDTMLHTIYGFMCAALAFSLFDIANKNIDTAEKFKFNKLYLCANSIGFTMMVAVLWEFFEFGMDNLFGKDMQKDTIIDHFNSVTLDETMSNIAVPVKNIKSVVINGQDLGLGGYLDIGLYDTMKDMGVALLGATIFCIFLYTYLKSGGKNKVAALFIPIKRNWDEKPPEIESDLAKKIANLEHEIEELKARDNDKDFTES